MNNINFLQWNAQGISTSKQDLLHLIEIYKPLVLAIQETFLGNNHMVQLPNYVGYCKQGHYNHRFHGGVALYIHNSCPHQIIPTNCVYQNIAAQVNVKYNKTITVASVYIPGRTCLELNNLNNLISNFTRPYLLLGDFNTHNEIWGEFIPTSFNRQRSSIIENFLDINSLNCINSRIQTHISGTAIDLSISTADITPELSWYVLPNVLSSDHHPIVISQLNHETMQVSDDQTLYNFKKGRWEDYANDEIWKHLPNSSNEAELVQDIYSRFKSAAKRNIPTYKYRRYFPKSWWTSECTAAFKEREKLYRRYMNDKSDFNKIAWKKARSTAKYLFRKSKTENLHSFLDKMTLDVPAAIIYDKLRKMRGKPTRHISFLTTPGGTVTNLQGIVDTLAEAFANISNITNYHPTFRIIKEITESTQLDFNSANNEEYNLPFTLHELNFALSSVKSTTPGPDNVHYLMMKSLPKQALLHLLSVFNAIWTSNYYPEDWKYATIIPILKPNKSAIDPANYRPIALTSCFGKIMEKMVNLRLVEHLEKNNLLCNIQCGFRKGRSTIDHLVRLETYIKKAKASDKHTISIFFDIEKAYDTTWRYGILQDLLSLGIKGRLPLFIQNFLKERKFKVRINSTTSREYTQVCGVPQGSILSVTLFAIKINSLATIIPPDILSSLFVDDLQISYSDYNLQHIECKLQTTVDSISKWALNNGFKFSPTKTKTIVFPCNRHVLIKPKLYINNQIIPVVDNIKFLGLWWDSKLAWTHHLAQLKGRCLQAMNLLRSLATTEWGASQEILLRVFRISIRSKLDYGCIIYSSAAPHLLKTLDTVVSEALRISTGAFRTTPIQSLHILANEPHPTHRRTMLLLRYFYKMKSHINNPAHSNIVKDNLKLFFSSRPSFSPGIVLRANKALASLHLPTQPIMPNRTIDMFSWNIKRPVIDYSLRAAQEILRMPGVGAAYFNHFMHENYKHHYKIYTDGSKNNHGVGAAAISDDTSQHVSMPKNSSIFTAEIKALLLACNIIQTIFSTNLILICTDSLSSQQAIERFTHKNQIVRMLQRKLHDLITNGYNITIIWTPAHCNIAGNEKADQLAKHATKKFPEFINIPYTDYFPLISKRIYEQWTQEWSRSGKLLHRIKTTPGPWPKIVLKRKQEVILNRLRLDHTKLTRSFLMDETIVGPRMPCERCYEDLLTVEHILIYCPALEPQRTIHLKPNYNDLNIETLLEEHTNTTPLFTFLKEVNIYNEI